MAPPPPPSPATRNPRRPHDDTRYPRPQRSHSFGTRMSTAPPSPPQSLRRPRTQPDLRSAASGAGGVSPPPTPRTLAGEGPMVRRVPTKVLVSVTVQRSLGPVQVMASAEWNVAELATAAVKLYVKEGRRPQLPTTDPADFDLHYSQFSLDCLDPQQKLMDLGSRNFFLYPKSASSPLSTAASSSSLREGQSKMPDDWLRFMVFVM